MEKQESLVLAASVVGGVLLGLGISKLMSRKQKKVRFKGRLQLYHTKAMKSSRVQWAIEELGMGQDCDVIQYDPYAASPEDKAWYRANIHPNGLIPALILPDGEIMFESAAICFYLAQYRQLLLPPSPALCDYYSWSLYAACTLEPSIHTLYTQNFMTKASEQDTELQQTCTKCATEGIARLEQHLLTRDYICGSSFTMADVIVGYTIMFASTIRGGLLLANYPKTKAYLEHLKSRPHFTQSMGTLRDWIQYGS